MRLNTIPSELIPYLFRAHIILAIHLSCNLKKIVLFFSQLITPFDMHETLKHILSLSGGPKTTETVQRGHSIFKRVPERDCDDAAIPQEYCSCFPKVPSTIDLGIVQMGAKEIVKSINANLPQNCSLLSARKVTAALVVAQESLNDTTVLTDYSIAFETTPGDFSFEATATFDQKLGMFTQVSEVQRTNKKTEDVNCLSDAESRHELFCHCE